MAADFLIVSGCLPAGSSHQSKGQRPPTPNGRSARTKRCKQITAEGEVAARKDIADKLAAILFGHILRLTIVALQRRSAADLPQSAAPSVLRRSFDRSKFRSPRADLAGDRSACISASRSDEPRLLEGLHAHHRARGTRSRQSMTRILVRYEFERRLDGTPEGLLLPPRTAPGNHRPGHLLRGSSSYGLRSPRRRALSDRLVMPGGGHLIAATSSGSSPAPPCPADIYFAAARRTPEIDRRLDKGALQRMLSGAGDGSPVLVAALLGGIVRSRPTLSQRLRSAFLRLPLPSSQTKRSLHDALAK